MSKPNLALVVLAAGIGSRYGGLKQVDPIGPSGELIIDYSVYDGLRAGFTRVVFVISHAIEDVFRERVGRTIERQCPTSYVFQELADLPPGYSVPEGRAKPWGTAHATRSVRHEVDSPFAVINADDFYGRGSFETVARYLTGERPTNPGPAQYCMIGYRLENTLTEFGHVARGVCSMDAQSCLSGVVERTRIERFGSGAHYTEDGEHWIDLPLDATVSMNFWGFDAGFFPSLDERLKSFLDENASNLLKAEYFLPSVVNQLVKDGRAQVKVLATSERWYGMTYAQDRPRVKAAIQEMVEKGIYPSNLWGKA